MLNEEDLAEMQKIARRKIIKPHEPIFHDGDKVNHYFNILRGAVKLVKSLQDGKQHIVGLMYPPDLLAQPLGTRYTYTAEAATEVEVCVLQKGPFEALLKAHPQLERRMLEFTLRELDICRGWTLLLGHKSAYERVASFLFMTARRSQMAGCVREHDGPVRFELPLSRSEIADYLGLTLETVSRQFSRLKTKRIISISARREIIVPEMELLALVAQMDNCYQPDLPDE